MPGAGRSGWSGGANAARGWFGRNDLTACFYTLFRAPKSAGWETIPLALSCFISVVGMDRGWLKIRDAAAWAGISPKTLRNWLGGGLRHSRVGGIILIRRETLDEWLESHAVDAGQIDRLVNEVLREVSG